MAHAREVYELVAALLTWPDDTYATLIERGRDAVNRMGPEAAGMINRFAERVEDLTIEESQELFTVTFREDPRCHLNLVWCEHDLGDHASAELITRVREQFHRSATNLPDGIAYLGSVPSEEAVLLAARCVRPSVERILAGLSGKRNPYERVLNAACLLLARV